MAKSSTNPLFNIAAYQLVSTAICVAALPFVPLPNPAAWPMIIGSTAIHTFYYFSLARAYKSGDLSQVYPLFRGLAPVLVALAAMPLAGEYLSVGGMVGVLIISAGIMSLAFSRNVATRISGQALFWGLTTSVLIALYTVTDGLGVRAAGSPISYIVWLFAVESIPVVSIILLTRRHAWFGYMRSNTKQVLMGGVATTAAYGLVIYAMSLGAMAVVSSLRETSVIFATLIGTFILKEPFGMTRFRAACIVVAGVVVMRLA